MTMTDQERQDLVARWVYHRDMAARLEPQVKLAYEAKAIADKLEAASAADAMAEFDAVLTSTKPPELHEIYVKEAQVLDVSKKIALLEHSPKTSDWAEARRLYPELHRLEGEWKRMQQGMPAERAS